MEYIIIATVITLMIPGVILNILLTILFSGAIMALPMTALLILNTIGVI